VKRYDPTKRNCYCARGLTVTECEHVTALVADAPSDPLAFRAAAIADGRWSEHRRHVSAPVIAQLRDRHPLPDVCDFCYQPALCRHSRSALDCVCRAWCGRCTPWVPRP
jgi:hypothetical protein